MTSKLTAFTLALIVSVSTPALGQSFNLVINNGRVMDPETGFDQVANVGINNGYITEISTEDLDGAREIDATAMSVLIRPIRSDWNTMHSGSRPAMPSLSSILWTGTNGVLMPSTGSISWSGSKRPLHTSTLAILPSMQMKIRPASSASGFPSFSDLKRRYL